MVSAASVAAAAAAVNSCDTILSKRLLANLTAPARSVFVAADASDEVQIVNEDGNDNEEKSSSVKEDDEEDEEVDMDDDDDEEEEDDKANEGSEAETDNKPLAGKSQLLSCELTIHTQKRDVDDASANGSSSIDLDVAAN